jgi:hypothetical protein
MRPRESRSSPGPTPRGPARVVRDHGARTSAPGWPPPTPSCPGPRTHCGRNRRVRLDGRPSPTRRRPKRTRPARPPARRSGMVTRSRGVESQVCPEALPRREVLPARVPRNPAPRHPARTGYCKDSVPGRIVSRRRHPATPSSPREPVGTEHQTPPAPPFCEKDGLGGRKCSTGTRTCGNGKPLSHNDLPYSAWSR